MERWRSFARDSEAAMLACVLDGLLFDAPAPYLPAEALLDAVEEGLRAEGQRVPPPRPRTDDGPPPTEHEADAEAPRLAALAEEFLAGGDRVSVAVLLWRAGEWPAARRVMSQVVSIHHRGELAYELTWGDGLRVDADSTLTWVTDGWFGRAPDPTEVAGG